MSLVQTGVLELVSQSLLCPRAPLFFWVGIFNWNQIGTEYLHHYITQKGYLKLHFVGLSPVGQVQKIIFKNSKKNSDSFSIRTEPHVAHLRCDWMILSSLIQAGPIIQKFESRPQLERISYLWAFVILQQDYCLVPPFVCWVEKGGKKIFLTNTPCKVYLYKRTKIPINKMERLYM